MLAKVAGDSRFKVGEGDKTWNELEFVQPDSIQLGGGLATDQDGKIYVDFSQMPTEKFEALVKQIRVPIWLTKSTAFYVDGATGSDVISSGRGLSTDKAFKTIQACVNYVCDNYNLSRYNVTINIASGIYDGANLTFPNYQSSTGNISVAGAKDGSTIIKKTFTFSTATSSMQTTIKSYWLLYYLTFDNNVNMVDEKIGTAHLYWFIIDTGAIVWFNKCKFKITHSKAVTSGNSLNEILFSINSYAGLRIQHETSIEINEDYANTLNVFKLNISSALYWMTSTTQEAATCYISGRFSVFVNGTGFGTQITHGYSNAYKFRFIIPDGKTVTGKKFTLTNGAMINSSGLGTDWLPGSIAGTFDTTKYCVYS